jgi:acyl dehydratase
MDLAALAAHRFAPKRLSYSTKDTILYALSVGVGDDPTDSRQLRFSYEQGLVALPTMAAVLAHPGAWIADPVFKVNFLKLLHGEQNLTVHRTLPPEGEIEANYRVAGVVDKGADKGALVYFEKVLSDARSGEKLCTVSSTLFLRADGGCGGFGTAPPPLPAEPLAPASFAADLKTAVGAALLYRLNGDLNPIHVDPAAATKAGFERPILHGLCTYGVVGYLLTRSVCGNEPGRLRSLGARFSAPVYPGETIRVEGQRVANGVHFRALVPSRAEVVLSQGFAALE